MTKIIRIAPGVYFEQEVEVLSIDRGLSFEVIEELIGTYRIGIVSPVFLQTMYSESAVMIINDIGAMILGIEHNQLASHLYGGDIYGTVLIAKRSGENIVGLNNADALYEDLMKARRRKL